MRPSHTSAHPHTFGRFALVLGLALAAIPATAQAADGVQLQAAAGLAGAKTEWRGDVGGAYSFKLALRPNDWLSFYLLTKLGLASVDQRMTTLVSAGAQIYPLGGLDFAWPYFRLSICHQHEETLSVVKNDPGGALFGIGDGIRHRGGLEGALGLDLVIYEHEDIGVFATLETSTLWFYDPRGPQWYVGGGAGLGLSYDL